MKRILLLLIMGLLLASGPSHANPANCDAEMTEEQLTIKEACSSHIGCRFVYAIQESCVKIKSFLSRLGQLGKGSAAKETIEQDSETPQVQLNRSIFGKPKLVFTDDQVSEALAVTYQVPRSSIGACLIDLNVDKCKELLSGGTKKLDPQEQADEIAQRLIDMTIGIKSEQGGLEMSKGSLKNCESATRVTSPMSYEEAEKICAGTTKDAIVVCNRAKERYDAERAKLQSLIDSGSVTNNIYKKLASQPYPDCPTTLPESGKTIEAALAEYKKRAGSKLEGEAKKSLDLAKSEYEDVKRKYGKAGNKTSDAERGKDLQRLRTMKSFLEANEYKLSSGKAGGSEKLSAEMLKLMGDIDSLMTAISSMEEAEPVALSRQGRNSGTDMLKDAIARVEKAEQEEKERIAKGKAEQEEKERIAKEIAEQERKKRTRPPEVPPSPNPPATGGHRATISCWREWRKFAESQAVEYNNPRYLKMTPESVAADEEETFILSFQAWNDRPSGDWRQQMKDPTVLRKYAEDFLRYGNLGGREGPLSIYKSCLARKRLAELSQ